MTTEWGRSTYCGSASCVETRLGPAWAVHVRDSKLADSPILQFGTGQWCDFVDAIRGGEFQPTSSGN